MPAYKKKIKSIISIASIALAAIMVLGVFGSAVSAAGAPAAKPIASTVFVNGDNIAFDAYNIGGSNYFKLRDIAYALSGTEKQFEVEWDAANNAIRLTSGKPYTPVGGEMAVGAKGEKTPQPTPSKLIFDGREVSLAAYNIGGSNYFMLRDMGSMLDFAVDWNSEKNAIFIDTSRGYASADTSAPPPEILDYYTLTPAERQIYDKLAAGIANFDLEIEVPQLTNETSKRILLVLSATRPDLFWWVASWKFQETNKGSIVRPDYLVEGKEIKAVLNTDGSIKYPTKPELAEAKAGIARGKEEIRKVFEKLPVHGKMTPYEMELAVNNWMCDNIEYVDVYDEGASRQVRTIYGALVGRAANCVGFSSSFLWVMNMLGMDCLILYGQIDREEHQWNAVKLDGEWYNVDVTLNKSFYLNHDMRNNYYFNCTDGFLAANGYLTGKGMPERVNPNITCTATKYHYYEMETFTVNGTGWTYTGKLTSEGIRNGYGRMEWAAGDWYEGDWLNDNFHGHGIYVWANGDRYEGDWLNGQMHGQGTKTNANGTVQSGRWENGKFAGNR